MLKKVEEKDKEIWIQLNREFMEFEIQDEALWGNTARSSEAEFGKTFDAVIATPELITTFFIIQEVPPAILMPDNKIHCSQRINVADLVTVSKENFTRRSKANDASGSSTSGNGCIAGFVNLLTIFSVWAHGKALIIDDLYIKPEFRGQGIGRKTMAEIENFAKGKSYKRLQFQSEESNPGAKEFYSRIGYTPADMSFYVKHL